MSGYNLFEEAHAHVEEGTGHEGFDSGGNPPRGPGTGHQTAAGPRIDRRGDQGRRHPRLRAARPPDRQDRRDPPGPRSWRNPGAVRNSVCRLREEIRDGARQGRHEERGDGERWLLPPVHHPPADRNLHGPAPRVADRSAHVGHVGQGAAGQEQAADADAQGRRRAGPAGAERSASGNGADRRSHWVVGDQPDELGDHVPEGLRGQNRAGHLRSQTRQVYRDGRPAQEAGLVPSPNPH